MNVQHAAPEPARRSARRLGMLGATVVVAILATLLGPASPAAATTGVLNGRLQITAPPALPQDLVGASVEVYTLDRQLVTTLTTGAEGRFTWNPAPAANSMSMPVTVRPNEPVRLIQVPCSMNVAFGQNCFA